MSETRVIDESGFTLAESAWGAALPMLGSSPAIRKIQHLLRKVAPTDSSVLITGETGTGKELLARLIHALSPRRDKPFVAVNTSAIPENLQESELFGHKKGAFTGAVQDRLGLFEEAKGGTLFLDEIGETTPALQSKLLRALENRVIRRVGESGERGIDVRIIAATNRDLGELVRGGEFREDLFFRLNVVHLHLPPLREREGDLPLFLEAFLKKHSGRARKKIKGFDAEALAVLQAYPYPGNVRELDNIVQHAVLMADGSELGVPELPPYMLARPRLGGSASPAQGGLPEAGAVAAAREFMTLAEIENAAIRETLRRLKGNQSVAAKKLGISRSTLWRKMREYGIAS